MAGRRAFIAFCWPFLQGPSFVISFLTAELWALWAGTTMYTWWVAMWILAPPLDPYNPRAKHPSAYLGPFLDWLNASIDSLADLVAPSVIISSSSRCSDHRLSSSHFPQLPTRHSTTGACTWAAQCMHPIHAAALTLIYGKLTSTFFPWHVRNRHLCICALAAIAAGIAWTNSVAHPHSAAPPPCSRAIVDSDSFDILVDGGATACISNALSDFVKPPKASRVLLKASMVLPVA